MKYRMIVECTVPRDPKIYNPDTKEEFIVGDDDDDKAVKIAQDRVTEMQDREQFGKKFSLREVQRIIFPTK
jgi:hypothetical protein